MRGPAPRPSPVPGCPPQAAGLSGTSGPCPPLRGRLARARLRPAGPPAAWASAAASRHRSLRPSLAASAFRRGGPAPRSGGRSPRGSPPAGGSSPRLRPLSAGSARGSLRVLPCRGLRLALRGSAGSLGGRPWPVSGLGLGPLRAPPAAPGPPSPAPRLRAGGPRPAGLGPGSLRPWGGAALRAAFGGSAAPRAFGAPWRKCRLWAAICC